MGEANNRRLASRSWCHERQIVPACLQSRNRLGRGNNGKSGLAVVKEYAAKIGVSKLAPHDLRRSCARLCHEAGGELEQIQFLLGHVSVQTTEKYYVRKVDMCRGCRKSPVVNGRAWLDSA